MHRIPRSTSCSRQRRTTLPRASDREHASMDDASGGVQPVNAKSRGRGIPAPTLGTHRWICAPRKTTAFRRSRPEETPSSHTSRPSSVELRPVYECSGVGTPPITPPTGAAPIPDGRHSLPPDGIIGGAGSNRRERIAAASTESPPNISRTTSRVQLSRERTERGSVPVVGKPYSATHAARIPRLKQCPHRRYAGAPLARDAVAEPCQ